MQALSYLLDVPWCVSPARWRWRRLVCGHWQCIPCDFGSSAVSLWCRWSTLKWSHASLCWEEHQQVRWLSGATGSGRSKLVYASSHWAGDRKRVMEQEKKIPSCSKSVHGEKKRHINATLRLVRTFQRGQYNWTRLCVVSGQEFITAPLASPTLCRMYLFQHQTCRWEGISAVPLGNPPILSHCPSPYWAVTSRISWHHSLRISIRTHWQLLKEDSVCLLPSSGIIYTVHSLPKKTFYHVLLHLGLYILPVLFLHKHSDLELGF